MEQTGCDLILFGQKTPQSLIQQGLEGSTAVGKDEAGSSNLPSSSNNFHLNRKVCADFAIFLQLFTTFLRPKDLKNDLVAENRRFAN